MFLLALALHVAVTIKTLDTTNRTLPSDLAAGSFGSPDLAARWQAFLTNLVPRLGKRVKWVSLGNEVDIYLGNHPDEAVGYLAFLQSGRGVLKKLAPQVAVGVTCTYDGLVERADLVEKMEAWTDAVFMTYYPMTKTFGPRPLTEVPGDFGRMVKLAAGRKLVLQEIGLPASEAVGSSEQVQADFVHTVFEQLNKNADKVAFASYFLQYDFAPSVVDLLGTYYGSTDARFKGFLSSLGLKKADGTPRKAWRTFGEEAAAWFKS